MASPNYLSLQQEAENEKTMGSRLAELAQISTELAQMVAKNPSTPPELLGELSKSQDAKTRQHVAGNPNTPIDLLWELGVEFPQQLVNNPILCLLLLENPNLIDTIPQKTLCSIFTLETVPVYFRELALNYPKPWMRQRIAQNYKTHVSILELLAKDSDRTVRHHIAKHPKTPVSLMELLARDEDYWVRFGVATNPQAIARF